jgi:hypothetical protein
VVDESFQVMSLGTPTPTLSTHVVAPGILGYWLPAPQVHSERERKGCRGKPWNVEF